MIDRQQVRGFLLKRAIRFEEHVLVEVRQSVQLRRLCERAVADGQLYRDERNRVVFKHDDFKPVRKYAAYERRGLGYRPRGRGPLRRGLRRRCRARLLLRRGGARRPKTHERRGRERGGEREDKKIASNQC